MADVSNRNDCIIKKKIYVQKWKMRKKQISVICERVDRKIRPSRSQSGITQQAPWYQTVILGTDFSIYLSHLWSDPYITSQARIRLSHGCSLTYNICVVLYTLNMINNPCNWGNNHEAQPSRDIERRRDEEHKRRHNGTVAATDMQIKTDRWNTLAHAITTAEDLN